MRADRAGLVQLSVMQARILRMLCSEGGDSPELGARMGLKPNTVDSYIAELLAYLRLDSRQRLTLWGLQHPEAMEGAWCEPTLHPPGCRCPGKFCSILQCAA